MWNTAYIVEPTLWFLALYAYSRTAVATRLLSFRLYLVAQLACSVMLAAVGLLIYSNPGSSAQLVEMYSRLFWTGMLAAGMVAIWTLRSLFSRVLVPLVGLQRAGLAVYNWILMVVSFLTLTLVLHSWKQMALSQQLARVSYAVVVTEILLLLLVFPFTFAVRRSERSRYHEVMLGIGVMSISCALLCFGRTAESISPGSMVTTLHLVAITTLLFWIGSFVAEAKKPSEVQPLGRWREQLRVLDQDDAMPMERGR
jgi:hypothetical protein